VEALCVVDLRKTAKRQPAQTSGNDGGTPYGQCVHTLLEISF
jgi:hypothetical protein